MRLISLATLGEVIRGVPLYYPSWLKVPKERKAAFITDIRTSLILGAHESPDWNRIQRRHPAALAKSIQYQRRLAFKPHIGYRPHDRGLTNERRSGGHVLRTLQWKSGKSILSFGMIPGTLPEPLKIGKTGQRARSYLDRDPGRLLAFEMRWTELRHSREEMRRLEATGTYTDDKINRLARRGKQRGHIPGVGRVLPARATAGPSTPAFESTFESGGASGSGECEDDEESADAQEDEDEDGEAIVSCVIYGNQELGVWGSGIKRTHAYIPRDREEAEQRLLGDYFGDDETPKYSEENFRHIVRALHFLLK
ncbi:hypothetical protein Tco_1030717 [Tanacetum coccineum]|uniref:Uncharacterized protein n=1 Tax=Tanacetum coccineum TaxID=301880 RepID=A0ABQ5G705_9ASTR